MVALRALSSPQRLGKSSWRADLPPPISPRRRAFSCSSWRRRRSTVPDRVVDLAGTSELGALRISPDGATLAVATSAGIELVDLVALRLAAPTVAVDTTFTTVSWDGPRSVTMNGPTGVLELELDRTIGVGTMIARAESRPHLSPAPDGRSALVWSGREDNARVGEGGGAEWVDLETGTSVRLPTQEDAFAVLPDKALLTIDWAGPVVTRWEGGVLVSSVATELSSGLLAPEFTTMSVRGDLAAAFATELTDAGEPIASVVVLLDVRTGEPTMHLRSPFGDGAAGEVSSVHVMPGEHPLVSRDSKTWTSKKLLMAFK